MDEEELELLKHAVQRVEGTANLMGKREAEAYDDLLDELTNEYPADDK